MRAALPWVYGAGLVWLNAYIVRHVFWLTYTGATHSMHGYWMALGRVMGDGWLLPRWVPYWAGGMPAELTYAPLVPWLSSHIGLYAVLGFAFAIGPAAVFLLAWQLSGKPGWGFVAGVAYSLLSPTELLLPDARFNWAHVLDSRRLYLSFVWDEAPHQLALAIVCLAVAAWARGWHRCATAAIAIGALANPFGVTGAALLGLCWAVCTGQWRPVAVTGVLAYLLVCPFYPPSLLQVLRANGALAPESAWSNRSWLGVAGLAAAMAVLGWLTRRWAPHRRFAALLALSTSALPWMFNHWNIVILQQPGRYKSEMELALVLLAVFGAERILAGRPRWVLAGLAMAGMVFAAQQTIRHRRYSRNAIQQADASKSIEYQAAHAVSGTVFTMGSMAHWMNAYRDVRQYAGGSFTTTPNTVQQRVALELTVEKDSRKFVQWMQAAGVDGVLMPGRKSPEFWKPFAVDALAGHLRVVWEERDTRLYEIPRARRTMAHSISSLPPLAPYVKAIEDPAAPALSVEWPSANLALVQGNWRAGDMVLIHMNWDKEWNAYLDGRRVPAGADGMGQMVVAPGGNGRLELRYEPGWSTRVAALLALALLVFWPRRIALGMVSQARAARSDSVRARSLE